jgi:hypothetical protein
MKMDQTNDPRYRAAELAALLARHYPDAPHHLVARVVFDMQTAAKKAKRLATQSCNGELSEAQDARADAWMAEKTAEVNTVLAHPKLLITADYDPATIPAVCTVTLGGDPRGPCARLHIPGQHGDGWGDGYAIF